MAQVTVTATLNDTAGNTLPNTSSAFVRFVLRGYQGFVPRVAGTSIICETQIDSLPNGSGAISQLLWPNNGITPSSTWYEVQFWNLGRITSRGNYLINANTDLDTAAQLNAPPVPAGFSLVLEHNDVLNSSQNILDLKSTDASVTITDLGAGQINFQAPAQGPPSAPFMLGAGVFSLADAPLIGSWNFSPGGAGTALQLSVIKFINPFQITGFNRMDFFGRSANGAGTNIAVGIYDSTGSKVWSSGIVNMPSNGSGQTFDVTVPAFTLAPGTYYLAWTTDSNTNALVYGWDLSTICSTTLQNVVNQNAISVGFAANNATAGPVLPATLGTLSSFTGGGAFGSPALFFQKV